MSTATSIATLVETTPSVALLDPEAREKLFAHIEEEVSTFQYDLTTTVGRKAIGSLAYKISRTKTAIDDAGKVLIEAAQKTVNSTNAERKVVRERLDALRDKARKPLDDWEEADKARQARCEAVIAEIKSAATVTLDDTADGVTSRIERITALEIGRDEFRDHFDVAVDARTATTAALSAAVERLKREEADRAELERLRADREARDAKDRQIAHTRSIIEHIRACGDGTIGGQAYPLAILVRELETKIDLTEVVEELREEATNALNEARKKLQAVEDADRARREEEAEAEVRRRTAQAAEDALVEAAREAAAAQEEQDRAHQEELRKKDDQIAQQALEEKERQAEADRLEKEAQARAADQEHRSTIMRASKEALMEHGGIGEDRAKKIVLAIAAGNVPHVAITF